MGRPSDARQRLIEAARKVIFSQSYTKVSVDELCASAGVNKSSFYHFFSSKQELVLAAIDSHWEMFEPLLSQTLANQGPPHKRLLHFFALTLEKQQEQKSQDGYMRGCPAGNLTLEMSTQDEVIRARVAQLFQEWTTYFERLLRDGQEQGSIPATLDIAVTAQALLAYFEGVMLLAKGRNDPTLLHTLSLGALSLMHYQTSPAA